MAQTGTCVAEFRRMLAIVAATQTILDGRTGCK